MAWSIDARVVVFVGDFATVGAGDAVLFEGEHVPDSVIGECFTATPHAVDCECCGARSPAAVALDRLFGRRARGTVPFFRRVVAVTHSAEGDMAVFAALRHDPLVSARYRSEGES